MIIETEILFIVFYVNGPSKGLSFSLESGKGGMLLIKLLTESLAKVRTCPFTPLAASLYSSLTGTLSGHPPSWVRYQATGSDDEPFSVALQKQVALETVRGRIPALLRTPLSVVQIRRWRYIVPSTLLTS